MAFNHPDTDELFERSLRPVLTELGVSIVIINRRQDNRDINVQIIEQLLSADFAVVDLTYARPSVYFEAGFAERAVPVIYCVRKDHFLSGQPEHLRVHFDLQMKPLLTWNHPCDQQFRSKLRARLNSTVLKELREAERSSLVNHQEEVRYSVKSVSQRVHEAWRLALLELHQLDYREWRVLFWPGRRSRRILLDFLDPNPRTYSMIRKSLWQGHWVLGEKTIDKARAIATVLAASSLDQGTLKDVFAARFINTAYPPHYSKHFETRFQTSKHRCHEHHFMISLEPVSRSLIMKSMPSLSYLPKFDRYTVRLTIPEHHVIREVNLHIVSGFKSSGHLKARLAEAISQVV